MAEEKKSSTKTLIIILVIVIVLLLAGGVTFFILNGRDKPAESTPTVGGAIPYEPTAQMLTSNGNWNEEALKEAQENQIPIRYSATAMSTDGENFTCEMGNPTGAKYDIYFDMYADTSLEEQVFLSGLVAPGQQLSQFKTNRSFPKGEHDVVLVITTVEDDHKTLVAQTMVYLTLVVE